MPSRQPFTQLCLALARHRTSARVDLHMHTTASDGLYSPAQVVDLARRSGMPAIAITDHDTLEAIAPATLHAGASLRIIPGVEISAEFEGRELHLLGYFFNPEHAELNAALAELRTARRERFFAMAQRLREIGVVLDEHQVQIAANVGAVGRRHLAQLLVRERKTNSIREGFVRYLGDAARACVPKRRLPVADAIRLVRDAGGVSSWAHPGAECTWDAVKSLYNLGMRAIEVDWPTVKPSRGRVLRQWARALGMAMTAGSDCHGPDEPRRTLGARGIDLDELDHLQEQTLAAV